MRIVKPSTIRHYRQRYPDAQAFLDNWLKVARVAEWQSILEVRRQYPHADAATVASGNTVTIFNVAGNKYRLVVSIKYRMQTVFIRDFLTHAEYDKGHWKARH